MNVNLFLLEHRVCYIHIYSICSSLEKKCQYSRMSQQRPLLHSSSKTIIKKSKIVQIFKSSEKKIRLSWWFIHFWVGTRARRLCFWLISIAPLPCQPFWHYFLFFRRFSRYVWIKSKVIYLNAFFDFASVKAPKNNVALTIPRTKETRLIIFDFFSQNLEKKMFDKKSISKSSREFLEDTGHTILDLFNQENGFYYFWEKIIEKELF